MRAAVLLANANGVRLAQREWQPCARAASRTAPLLDLNFLAPTVAAPPPSPKKRDAYRVVGPRDVELAGSFLGPSPAAVVVEPRRREVAAPRRPEAAPAARAARPSYAPCAVVSD